MSPQYRVGILCALPIEHAAVVTLLDGNHPPICPLDDDNVYTAGSIGPHNVVITCLPAGIMGKVAASTTAANMKRSFPIEILLMVGIAGGLPPDVRLGDIVVSVPGPHGAVVQYDLGKSLSSGFERTGTLSKPPRAVLNAVQALRSHHLIHGDQLAQHLKAFPSAFAKPARDLLFGSKYEHVGKTCKDCDQSKLVANTPREVPHIHYGTIASADRVVKHSAERDRIAEETGALCFEMEAAALMDDYPCLVIRGICDYADSHKAKEWQPYASATAAAYMKELLMSMTLQAVAEDTGSELQKLLSSLAFSSMTFRQVNIDDAYGGTCQWLLEDESYMKWLSMSDDHFFWIKGKPGAGKSTLMKFAESCSPTGAHTRISFFFNARGDELEKSVMGMYRSLLHQLLSASPRNLLLHTDSWSLGHLKTALRLTVSNYPGPIQCFVDALDECSDGEAQDMIYFLQDLTRASPLYVCFASRFYPTITIKNALELVLDHKAHDRDVEEYVRGRLDVSNNGEGEQLVSQLLQKANGVFFWAVLVVKLLNVQLNSGNIHKVQETLASLPGELHALLQGIAVDGQHDEIFLAGLRWIWYYQGQELQASAYHVLVLSTVLALPDPSERQKRWAMDGSSLAKFVQSSSRGLAEIVVVDKAYSDTKKVQFVHESVRDFLRTNDGMQVLRGGKSDASIHDHLKEVAMRIVRAGWCITSLNPTDLAIRHANQAVLEISQDSFLLELQPAVLQNIARAKTTASRDGLDHYSYQVHNDLPVLQGDDGLDYELCLESRCSTIVHFLVSSLAYRLIPVARRLDFTFDHTGTCPPLMFVLHQSFESFFDPSFDEISTIEALLSTSVDVNEVFMGETALTLTVVSGTFMHRSASKIVRLLLANGADPNVMTLDGRTVLSVVCYKFGLEEVDGFDSSIVTALLDQGAQVHALNHDGSTALHHAVEYGRQECISMLLKAGADVNQEDRHRRTALVCAIKRPDGVVTQLDCIQTLLDGGADPNVRDSFGNTALACILSWRTGFGSIKKGMQGLIDAGANINAVNHVDGTTALTCVLRYGTPPSMLWGDGIDELLKGLVKILVGAGAAINRPDNDGLTALWYAVGRGADIYRVVLSGSRYVSRSHSEGYLYAARMHTAPRPFEARSENDDPSELETGTYMRPMSATMQRMTAYHGQHIKDRATRRASA